MSGIISERPLHKVESEDVVRQAFRCATRSISCTIDSQAGIRAHKS